MTAASRKIPFAVTAFLALAWPSAGEDPGQENDYGRDSIGGGTIMDVPERAPGLEARFGN